MLTIISHFSSSVVFLMMRHVSLLKRPGDNGTRLPNGKISMRSLRELLQSGAMEIMHLNLEVSSLLRSFEPLFSSPFFFSSHLFSSSLFFSSLLLSSQQLTVEEHAVAQGGCSKLLI